MAEVISMEPLMLIILFLIYLSGGASVILMIKNDIKKKKYTEIVSGMYLQKWAGPDKITKDRAIQFIIKIKENYPLVNIDKTLKSWIDAGFVE